MLAQYKTLGEQLTYRKQTIENLLRENQVNLEGLDACVGRGGGLLAMDGGTYEIDELVLEHSINAANGVIHPACLGPSIANDFAEKYGAKAYVVNPPDVDELQDLARLTGIKGVYRGVHLHACRIHCIMQWLCRELVRQMLHLQESTIQQVTCFWQVR